MSAALRQLLIRTHQGHEASARGLWESQAPRLFHYARAILPSHGDAEDVVQAVFCRVLDLPRREVERIEDPGAWLAKVTRREALNWLRAARREGARREVSGRLRLVRPETVDGAPADEELERAIGAMPRRLREVVVLRHVGGLTFDQIAAATGMNRSTAAARYRVAMTRLREQLVGGRGATEQTARADVREVGHVG